MSAIVLRVIILAIVLGIVAFGVRRIWLDWTKSFREADSKRRVRDLKERERTDVITLRRNQDGVYRPGDDDPR